MIKQLILPIKFQSRESENIPKMSIFSSLLSYFLSKEKKYQFLSVFFFSGKEKCDDLHSFEPSSVFAIHYDNWEWFFLAEKKSAVMDGIHSSFATHLWGHFFKQHIQWDALIQDQAFFHIAKQNCPNVFYTLLL